MHTCEHKSLKRLPTTVHSDHLMQKTALSSPDSVMFFAYQSRSTRADMLLEELLFSKCITEKVM